MCYVCVNLYVSLYLAPDLIRFAAKEPFFSQAQCLRLKSAANLLLFFDIRKPARDFSHFFIGKYIVFTMFFCLLVRYIPLRLLARHLMPVIFPLFVISSLSCARGVRLAIFLFPHSAFFSCIRPILADRKTPPHPHGTHLRQFPEILSWTQKQAATSLPPPSFFHFRWIISTALYVLASYPFLIRCFPRKRYVVAASGFCPRPSSCRNTLATSR